MLNKEKILIVDDETAILGLLNQALMMDYEDIDLADCGAEAIKLLEEKRYDLVLTDIMMPEVDGLDVLKSAKDKYDDIVVIMMTGKATVESAIESVNLGADEFITKPFDIVYLLKKVRAYLQKQQLGRENIKLHQQIIKDREILRKNLAELSVLYDLTKNLSYNFDISEVHNSVLNSLKEAVNNDFCSVYGIKRNVIRINSNIVINDQIKKWLETELKSFLKVNTSDIVPEMETEFNVDLIEEPIEIDCEVQHCYNVMLKDEKEIYGVLNINRLSDIDFSNEDMEFIRKIAEQSSEVFSGLQDVINSQKGRMQKLIEEIPDSIIVIDEKQGWILVNPSAMSTFFENEVEIDKSLIETVLNFELEDLYDTLDKSSRPFFKEIDLQKKDGSTFVFDAHITRIGDPEDTIQGILMVLRDVTKDRELNRLKSEFISNVSHELRTPAAVVKEFVSILKDKIAGPVTEEQDEYLGIMSNNIERLLRLIDNILNLTRMEAGIITLKKSTFSLQKMMEGVYNSMQVRLNQKNIKLKREFKDDLPEIYADKDALIQVLFNCLENSYKFSEDNTTVTLGAVIRDNTLLLSVKDQGRGIPKDVQDSIFARFYRIENKQFEREEGSGLGLSIVKEFIDLHEGEIDLVSEPEKGTTFNFRIPLKRKDEISEVKSG